VADRGVLWVQPSRLISSILHIVLLKINNTNLGSILAQPDASITWTTTYGGTSGNPWSISNGGKTIRYSLEDSRNCGGSNPNAQTGTAEAVIINTTSNITMGFSFTGIAELEAVGFENIQFYLEDVP